MVVLVSGYSEEAIKKNPMEMIDELISLGYRNKDAIKETATALNLDKHELYDQYILYKNNK